MYGKRCCCEYGISRVFDGCADEMLLLPWWMWGDVCGCDVEERQEDERHHHMRGMCMMRHEQEEEDRRRRDEPTQRRVREETEWEGQAFK